MAKYFSNIHPGGFACQTNELGKPIPSKFSGLDHSSKQKGKLVRVGALRMLMQEKDNVGMTYRKAVESSPDTVYRKKLWLKEGKAL